MQFMQLIAQKIPLSELNNMAKSGFGNLVKAVVDLEKSVMVVDASLHSDEEAYLLENGSIQQNLWGINLYPDLYGTDDFIEYDSMINLRPNSGNLSRGVDNAQTRKKIKDLVDKLVTK